MLLHGGPSHNQVSRYEQKKTPQKRKYEEHDASVDVWIRITAAHGRFRLYDACLSVIIPHIVTQLLRVRWPSVLTPLRRRSATRLPQQVCLHRALTPPSSAIVRYEFLRTEVRARGALWAAVLHGWGLDRQRAQRRRPTLKKCTRRCSTYVTPQSVGCNLRRICGAVLCMQALPSIADKAKATESAGSKRPEAKEEPLVPKAKPAVAPKKEPAPKPVVDENLGAKLCHIFPSPSFIRYAPTQLTQMQMRQGGARASQRQSRQRPLYPAT